MESHSNSENRKSPIHRRRGEGEAVWAMGSLFEIKLDSAETAGGFELAEIHQPPGVATPLHSHEREAEMFYVVDGILDYEAGGEMYRLETGSTMYLPMGVPHRFRIRGNTPATILALVSPGGLFDLYRRVGVPAGDRSIPEYPDPAEFGRWGDIAPRFGLEVLGSPIPE